MLRRPLMTVLLFLGAASITSCTATETIANNPFSNRGPSIHDSGLSLTQTAARTPGLTSGTTRTSATNLARRAVVRIGGDIFSDFPMRLKGRKKPFAIASGN